MFGRRMVDAFTEVKTIFDPDGLMNPGKIVNPPRMDDRELFRFPPGYAEIPVTSGLDWGEWGSLGAAVEMCNNNGTCRKSNPGVMCPSFRVTHDEKHLTRGRANTLRLALTGQLGEHALTSDELYESMDLCVGCKGCKRECPTGVDMARMKIEFLHQYRKRHGMRPWDRLVCALPEIGPKLAKFPVAMAWFNWLQTQAPVKWLLRRLLGLSPERDLPAWRTDYFGARATDTPMPTTETDVVLWVDTFTRWFEPDNARAALAVLTAAGYQVEVAGLSDGQGPLCCGRPQLAAGQIDAARVTALRFSEALRPYVSRGIPIVGLEPSCVFSSRDEHTVLLDAERAEPLDRAVMLFEEFVDQELKNGNWQLELTGRPGQTALLHGHCHQKAFGAMSSVERTLNQVPGLKVETVDTSCCGMAGTFGYEEDHFDVSMRMAELNLLPAVRASKDSALVVADGTSCRHQILDGTGRTAVHVARVLADALPRH